LARHFERYATTAIAFIRLAMIRIMLRRLAASPRREWWRNLGRGYRPFGPTILDSKELNKLTFAPQSMT